MESCSIVANSTIQQYKMYQRRWYAGWIVSGLMLVVSIYLGVLAKMRGDAISSLGAARADIAKLQADQRVLLENFVKAWQNQQATADALISYGEYHKERRALVDSNVQASKDPDAKNPWK